MTKCKSVSFGSVTTAERGVFERWAEQFDHDSDRWEDMGRDDVFIAGMRVRAVANASALVEAFDAGRRAAQSEAATLADALRAMIDEASSASKVYATETVLRAIEALAAHRKGGDV